MKEHGDLKPGLQPYLLFSAYWVVEICCAYAWLRPARPLGCIHELHAHAGVVDFVTSTGTRFRWRMESSVRHTIGAWRGTFTPGVANGVRPGGADTMIP